MNAKTRYIFVGLFVLALSLTFIGGVLWLGSGGTGGTYDEYVVRMQESVAGLSRDSAVKYYGVNVGRVSKLELDSTRGGRVRLLLQVNKNTPIKEDTVATLAIQGLTGLAYINLTDGRRNSPLLKAGPGQAYPEIRSQPSVWGRLSDSLGELLISLTDTSKKLNRLLNADNQQHFADTLADLHTLSATFAGRAASMTASLDDLAGAAHNARKASERLPELVQRLERMADEISAAGVSVRQTVESRDKDLQRFSDATLPKATAVVDELYQAAASLRRLSQDLERNPGILLQTESPPPPGPGE